MACVLAGCQGYITSPEPLIDATNASWPVASSAEVESLVLNQDLVWERNEGKAHLTLVDQSYRLAGPDEAAPSSDTFLFKQIGHGMFVVQANNGKEWAYGLIVRLDMDYLFTFGTAGQNCTDLSAAERNRFRMTVSNDGCSVANLKDLTGLLLYLRQRFRNPTSAFSVH